MNDIEVIEGNANNGMTQFCYAIQEKALKEYRQKKGEFIHPLDWRHPSHDIYAAESMVQITSQPVESKSNGFKDRLDGLQGEVRYAINKLNKHMDASKKGKGAAF